MEAAKRRSQRDYTLTFKLSVVDQVERGELTHGDKPTGLLQAQSRRCCSVHSGSANCRLRSAKASATTTLGHLKVAIFAALPTSTSAASGARSVVFNSARKAFAGGPQSRLPQDD